MTKGARRQNLAALDQRIDKITAEAHGDDEALWAFRQAFEAEGGLPADGFVVGEPVSVVAIDYGGKVRRGLEAQCRRADGTEHGLAAADVVFPAGSAGARLVAAYRRWLGLDPDPGSAARAPGRQHQGGADDLDLGQPIDLVVLSLKENAARCRVPRTGRTLTLRASGLGDLVPGEIATVAPRKQWNCAGHPYLSGDIGETRLDMEALGLVPLGLDPQGIWDPRSHYWGEPDEPVEAWARPIIARGPRPQFEMEQVLPGTDPDDPFSDPILVANDCKDSGDAQGGRRLLMGLCQSDLRCLDAHAHLGNLAFEDWPEVALRHYAVGVGIGDLTLGPGFEGVLPWGHVDNRPFLRCLQGYGLCLWKLGRPGEAAAVFERLLWLNPWDNQGVRCLLEPCRAGANWGPGENGMGFDSCSRSLEVLRNTPPWDWPEETGALLLEVLRDGEAPEADRLLAAELAGGCRAINDEVAEGLLAIAAAGGESEALRGQAANALGTVLELGDRDGFEDPGAVPVSEAAFRRLQDGLRRLYLDAGVPKAVRRQALEAAVRAPKPWQQGAVRAALASGDREWRLTGICCARWVQGFDDSIVAALASRDPDLVYQALLAAANWAVPGAWPQVASLLEATVTPKALRLAAIEAAASVCPQAAEERLYHLADAEDEDIAEAAQEALSMIEGLMGEAWGEDAWDD